MNRVIFILILSISCISCNGQETMSRSLSSQNSNSELDSIINLIGVNFISDSTFMSIFKEAQLNWQSSIESDFEMRFPNREKQYYGSIFPTCFESYFADRIQQRIKYLEKWLEGEKEGELCLGSIPISGRYEIKLDDINESELVQLINNITIIKEYETETNSIRIFETINEPGSAQTEETHEVNSNLLIAISEFDEYPKQNLFKVSNLINPKLIKAETVNSKEIVHIEYGYHHSRKIIIIKYDINDAKITSR